MQNDKIHLYTYCEVDKVSGFVGNFSVTIKQKPRYVDPVKCTGCGAVYREMSVQEDTKRV